MDIERTVHVVGAGGIGVALAVALMRAGCAVVIVDAVESKVEAGRAAGARVVGCDSMPATFVAFDDWTPPQRDPILLCTKTFDNPAVLARLPPGATLIPVQNGYDPLLESAGHAGEGIASFVSECARDRPETRITRPGCLHIGPRRAATGEDCASLRQLALSLGSGGLFPVEYVDDVRPYKATKLMYNAAISPLAAAAGVDNGELLSDGLAKTLFFALLRENYAILRNAHVPLARIGPFHPDNVDRILRTPLLPNLMAVFFRPSLRGTYCSMAPDIGSGRTEIEAYNGHLIRLAGDFPCPLNRAAHALVQRISSERLAPDRVHLEYVAAALPAGRPA